MGDIICLQEERQARRPHLSGEAVCFACGHQFVCVIAAHAYEDDQFFECPSCRTKRATFVNRVERDGRHWHCHCGSILFMLHEAGPYCPNCGAWTVGYEPDPELAPALEPDH